MNPGRRRSLGIVIVYVVALIATSCGGSEDSDLAHPPIDLVDPCSFATTHIITQAVGTTMLRSPTGAQDADRYRVCRWSADPLAVDEPTIEYLSTDPRPFVDIVLRQSVEGAGPSVQDLFDEASGATNIRTVSKLLATPQSPFLADGAVRSDSSLWVLKGERMAIVLTHESRTLDILIDSILVQLVDRL